MNKIYLFNTLKREKKELKVKNNQVGLYTCGPTVYNYAHLGNLRTYIFEDILKRVLKYNGYKVKHVMNITDVGHLTNDRDMGEDKVEMEARKEHKTAKEITEFYTKSFKDDLRLLNIEEPDKWAPATEYIEEQKDLVKLLEKKGFTYQTSDGIYFNTAKFKNYNKLSHQPLTQLKEGARVEKNLEKKNPTDFALWKFAPKGSRQMEWNSPWGWGFPGWHLECAAISSTVFKELKINRDIHCGGIDHIDVHHTNEIAEYEAAYAEPFFKVWMHGAFLNIEGGKKMAKSEGNFLTLENAIINKGYNPMAYRLMCLGAHYQTPLTWNETAIKNFNQALTIIRNDYQRILRNTNEKKISAYKKEMGSYFQSIYLLKEFVKEINNDLNMPNALSHFWDVKNGTTSSPEEKITLMREMDKVLGLGLEKIKATELIIPNEAKALIKEREKARADKNWAKSDELRKQTEDLGYIVEDTKDGQRILKK